MNNRYSTILPADLYLQTLYSLSKENIMQYKYE